MKSIFLLLFAFAFSICTPNDSVPGEIKKTGWNLGLLPVVAFDSDLGMQYGGLVNFFFYGSRYPVYDHSLYFEISRYTKGSGINRFYYDSDKIIKNIRTTADLSYLTEDALDFYGFNGSKTIYHPEWEKQESDNYKSRVFYRHARKLTRVSVDLQKRIPSFTKFSILAGVAHYNYKLASVDINKLNKGKSTEDKLPSIDSVPGLYEKYITWGLIPENEKDGGTVNYLKTGLIFDSRDNEPNPNKGIWAEVVLAFDPGMFGKQNSAHVKSIGIWRQYITLVKNKLTFAYRIAYQGNIAGHCPFYALPYMHSTMNKTAIPEGLGGAKTTRGVLRNRIIGDDIVYWNFELRSKLYHTKLWKQNFYFGINLFYDGGTISDIVAQDKSKVPGFEKAKYFSEESDFLHHSIGTGIRVVMNQNFVVAFDFGQSLNSNDGNKGIYIGLNYLF